MSGCRARPGRIRLRVSFERRPERPDYPRLRLPAMVDDDLIRIIAQAFADAREKGLEDVDQTGHAVRAVMAARPDMTPDGERCLTAGQYVAAGIGAAFRRRSGTHWGTFAVIGGNCALGGSATP